MPQHGADHNGTRNDVKNIVNNVAEAFILEYFHALDLPQTWFALAGSLVAQGHLPGPGSRGLVDRTLGI